MSLIALLAAQQSGGGLPAPVDPRPDPLDDMVADIRPIGRVIFTASVEADGTGDYPTITDAITAGRAAQAAALQAAGLHSSQVTPNFAVRIIIGPGYYDGPVITMPAFTEVYGAGGDQTILTTTQSGLGVFNIGGRVYVEGVAFLKTTPASEWTPKYAVHNASQETTIWADCGFYQDAVSLDVETNRTSGNDAGSDSTVLFYRCRLSGPANSHGWDTNTGPHTVMFVDCTSASTVGFRSGDGGGGLQPDVTWAVGGHVREVAVIGVNATLHLDPATVRETVTTREGVTVTDRTDWPVPYGGMSAADRERYGM